MDAQMRDAVTRCMQSKALSDSIAAAVGAGLQVREIDVKMSTEKLVACQIVQGLLISHHYH